MLVAFTVAALALSWFLYFLSEVRYTQANARLHLEQVDRSYGALLEVLRDFKPDQLPEGVEVSALHEGGPFWLEAELEGTLWQLCFLPSSSLTQPKIQIKKPDIRKLFRGLREQQPTVLPFGL